MDRNVMLAVHGYSPDGMENGREPEKVWSDRLRKADQVLRKLAGMGFDPVVVFPVAESSMEGQRLNISGSTLPRTSLRW